MNTLTASIGIDIDVVTRYPLAHLLLRMWEHTYPTKYVRFAYHVITAREHFGIPGPFIADDLTRDDNE